MLDGPNIARIAALIGDPARANMLCALMDGRALTASELSSEGGVTKQTASAHLGRLEAAGLLVREAQGRHRYFRLANEDVAHAIEALMGVANRKGGTRVRTGPRDPALRRARLCYDHLAGDIAVKMLDELVGNGLVEMRPGVDQLFLTQSGRSAFEGVGIALKTLEAGRRPVCRKCLDWSARRSHLAGALGAVLFTHAQSKGWVHRQPDSRVVHVSPAGEAELLSLCR